MNVWDSNILLLILLLNRVQCGSQQNVRHCLGKIPFGILTASDEFDVRSVGRVFCQNIFLYRVFESNRD